MSLKLFQNKKSCALFCFVLKSLPHTMATVIYLGWVPAGVHCSGFAGTVSGMEVRLPLPAVWPLSTVPAVAEGRWDRPGLCLCLPLPPLWGPSGNRALHSPILVRTAGFHKKHLAMCSSRCFVTSPEVSLDPGEQLVTGHTCTCWRNHPRGCGSKPSILRPRKGAGSCPMPFAKHISPQENALSYKEFLGDDHPLNARICCAAAGLCASRFSRAIQS